MASAPPTSYCPSEADKQSECAFCFGLYAKDGKEWVECACGQWIHENCMEDLYVDVDGQERFCPFCLNERLY